MTTRLTFDEMWLLTALIVSHRATCPRKSVGCVLVDNANRILSSGYNGVASGLYHCIESPCEGAEYGKGEHLDKCEAIHAEQNALLQCQNYREIHTCYVTASPCVHCLKMLLNTSCKRIVFLTEYHHTESKKLWLGAGREWIQLDLTLARRLTQL